jgi:hypothetical protein
MGIVLNLLLRHSLVDRVGLHKLLWRTEALDCSGKLARRQFSLQESRLIYEQLAELVDTELIP